MIMKKHTMSLAAILLTLVAVTANAAPIDADAAREIAAHFMSSHTGGTRFNHSEVSWTLAHARLSSARQGAADYYVFNADDGITFIIIAGDDRANEVLAYGNGPFDASNVPDNLRWMLDQYAEQVEYLIAHPGAQTAVVRSSTTVVPQLITTEWGQRTPYRNMCPTVDGKPCVTGCVATSMAQVMKYWKHPAILPALPAYYTSQGLRVAELPATSAEWNLMLDTYPEGAYTQEQADAVATLMRYCGQASKMDYTIGSSAAFMSDQLSGIKKFGYNQEAKLLSRSDYSDEEWMGLIIEDLSAQRPVIYCGRSVTMIHNFILDGYDGSKFHVNWGWDGMYDGYYALDAMNGGGFTPSYNHTMLHGVFPEDSGTSPSFDFLKNGITYIITGDHQVAVCPNPNHKYSGDLIIPDSVSFDGIQYQVTAINDRAFSMCSGLTSITIPSSVTTIGNSAFWGSGIRQVAIPSSVTAIGTSAFQNCSALNQVELSPALKVINIYMFANCSALTSIEIPDGVISIGDRAFTKSGLKAIIIPDNVSSIGTSAFEGCEGLTEVTLGSGVKSISNTVFKDCKSLKSISIPDNVTTIGTSAFENCKAFLGVTLGSGITSIGPTAFKSCESMRYLIIPDNVTSVGASAFESCKSMTKVTLGGGIKAIASSLFKDCESLKDINIPDTVTSIGQEAFSGCKSLTGINLSDNITSIGSSAFKGCAGITSIDIPVKVTTIADNTFNGTGITQLVIPETVRQISSAAFMNCANLSTVTIMSTSLTLGDKAFANSNIETLTCYCPNLPSARASCFSNSVYQNASLYVPYALVELYRETSPWSQFTKIIPLDEDFASIDGMHFIHNGERTACLSAYKGSSESVVIPETIEAGDTVYTVNEIGHFAFEHCTSLKNIAIPGTITKIGNNAFGRCTNLQQVHLSDAVSSIGQSAFENCVSLSSVTLGSGISDISASTFKKCSSLDSIHLPDNIITIGEWAFYSSGLASVIIPESVTSIGNHAFGNCSRLSSIILNPQNLIIGESALDCPNLGIVTCKSKIPPTAKSSTFNSDTYASAILTVTIESERIYKSTEPWMNFENILVTDEGLMSQDDFYYRATSDSTAALSRYVGSNDSVAIPERITIDGATYRVNAIDNHAFWRCADMRSITIPSSIINSGKNAFEGCTSLTDVRIQDIASWCGITFANTSANPLTIASHLFIDGQEAHDIIVPDSAVTAIHDYAFTRFKGLTSITLGEGIESIGEHAFDGCEHVSSITLPSTVKAIGDYAFYDCRSLTGITIPDAVQHLGVFAFVNNSRLRYATLGNGLTVINDNTFACCTSMKRVTLPSHLQSIGYSAFSLCLSLDSLEVPSTLSSIAEHAFNGCSQLFHVFIDDLAAWCRIDFDTWDSTPFYLRGGHLYLDGKELIDCVIPSGITTINDYAFARCNHLRSVVLPSSVTAIGQEAFKGCTALAYLTIHQGISQIAPNAFTACDALSKVISHPVAVPAMLDENVFTMNTYTNATLYVPAASLPDYLTAYGWKYFNHVKTIERDIITGDVNGDGEVNIHDVNIVLNLIMAGDTDPVGDVDGDQEVNIGDITLLIHIILEGFQPDLSRAVKPIITYDRETFTVTATSPDNVVLMVDGAIVENPHTFQPTATDAQYTVIAYAWADGKENSDYAWMRLYVPSISDESHPFGYWLVQYNAVGEKIYTELIQGQNGDYVNVDDVIYPEFYEICSFYFLIDGHPYGAPEDMTEAYLGDANENPLIPGTNRYYVGVGHNYTFGVHLDRDSNTGEILGYYAYVAKGGLVDACEINAGKAVVGVRYYNLAGQEMPEPCGLTIVVTTYSDGSTSAIKVLK